MKIKTNNYKQFKFLEKNRDIKSVNYDLVKKSILTKNLLHLSPIIVNERMEVIDGQHRLKIAEELGLDIWYEVHSDFKDTDLLLLNNQCQWSNLDYLKFFVTSENQEYIKLKSFMDKYKLSIKLAFTLLFGHHGMYTSFKAGTFKFPPDTVMFDVIETYDFVSSVIDYLKPKLNGPKSFLTSVAFYRAFYELCHIKYFDKEVFMSKLAYRLDLLHPCTTTKNYLFILKKIYNYRNANPLKMVEEIEEYATNSA